MLFCGSPDGLSFLNTSIPWLPAGWAGNVRVAVKGTKSSVIHSHWAWATTVVIRTLFASRSSIGNDASKYHGPRARPVRVIGLVIAVFGSGEVTSIISNALFAVSGESFHWVISDSMVTETSSTITGAFARCVYKKNAKATTIIATLIQENIFFIKIVLRTFQCMY